MRIGRGASKSGYLTTQNTYPVGILTGNAGTKDGFTFQVDFDNEPGNYTIQFNVTNIRPTRNGDGPGNITPTAEVIWSVEGNSVRRLVSVVNGTSITGIGQGIRVRVFDETDPGDTTAQQSYTVSVQVTRGSRPSIQQPPTYGQYYTDSQGNVLFSSIVVLAGGASIIQVPQNIGAVSVWITAYYPGQSFTDADLYVLQEDSALSAQASQIGLLNNTPNVGGSPITFGILFGIDG